MRSLVPWTLIAATFAIASSQVNAVNEEEEITTTSLRSLESSSTLQSHHRSLYRLDILLTELDECENGVNQFGRCNLTRFPNCTELSLQQGQTLYPCYNRKPHRSRFWPDHEPKYFIRYSRVQCFPKNSICSSCTPGRLCQSERRCILDELRYNCSQWF